MILSRFSPDPRDTRLITLASLASVIIITYAVLASGVFLKLRGELPQPAVLWFLKNWGFLLYAVPLLFVVTSRLRIQAEESSGEPNPTLRLWDNIFSSCWALLFFLPVIAGIASVQGMCTMTLTASG